MKFNNLPVILGCLFGISCTYDYEALRAHDLENPDGQPGTGGGSAGSGGIGGQAGGVGGVMADGGDALQADAALEAAGGDAVITKCNPSWDRLGMTCPSGQECAAKFLATGRGIAVDCITSWSGGNAWGTVCTNYSTLPNDCHTGHACGKITSSATLRGCLKLCRCSDGPSTCPSGGSVCKWFKDDSGALTLDKLVACTVGDQGWGDGIGICQ